MLAKIFLAMLVTLLLGCGDRDDEPLKETVFDAQIDALDKAKAVEQDLQESFDKQREALENP